MSVQVSTFNAPSCKPKPLFLLAENKHNPGKEARNNRKALQKNKELGYSKKRKSTVFPHQTTDYIRVVETTNADYFSPPCRTDSLVISSRCLWSLPLARDLRLDADEE